MSSLPTAEGPAQPEPNPRRRWCIPPAITRDPHETLEAAHLLSEVAGETGLLLWQAVRDVTLWSSIAPERRPGLFAKGAEEKRLDRIADSGADPALERPLIGLVALLGDPAGMSAADVSADCAAIARHLAGLGALHSALTWTQAAALALPDDPRAALQVGRAALRAGQHPRALTWLRRAVGLARRADDRETYGEAYAALGELRHRGGTPEAARHAYLRALRTARRHGLGATRARALHGMAVLAAATGEPAQAERYARLGLRAARRGLPSLRARLVQELAAAYVAQERHDRALSLLRTALPTLPEGPARLNAYTLLALAAAGQGRRDLFDEAWHGAWELLRALDPADAPADAMATLARAATWLRDWRRVRQVSLHQGEPDEPPRREGARIGAG